MAAFNPMADDRRPSVRMLITQGANVDLQAVFNGLEEEGIPIDVQESPRGDAVALAKEAAHMSPLNVGLGINGADQTVALHHRDLPADHPLFVIKLPARNGELRRLGINAARLVKGEPLVLEEAVRPEPQAAFSRGGNAVDAANDLIERIVQSVMADLVKA